MSAKIDRSEYEMILKMRQEKEEIEKAKQREEEREKSALKLITKKDKAPLSEAERAHLIQLYKAYEGNISSVEAHGSESKSGLGIRTTLVDPETQMNGSDAFSLKSPFLHVMMAPLNLNHTEITQEHMESLKSFVMSVGEPSPLLATHYDLERQRDRDHWSVFFPRKKAHIGIFRNVKNDGAVLIVSSHAGPALAQEISSIAAEPGMTIGRMTRDPRIHWINSISERNCKRLLYLGAKSMGISVSSCQDVFARKEGILARPHVAMPCHHTLYNAISTTPDRKHVILMHGMRHPHVGRGCPLVYGGSLHGYATVSEKHTSVTTKKHKRGCHPHHKKHKCDKHRRRFHSLSSKEMQVETHSAFPSFSNRFKTIYVVHA